LTKRILIVAPEKSASGPLSEILVRMGMGFSVAESMESAFGELDRLAADLILCEFKLPDGTAIEFCERLRRLDESSKTPVICLASSQQAEHYSETPSELVVPNDWLCRPVSRDSVVEKVQYWLFGRDAAGPPLKVDSSINEPRKRFRQGKQSGTFGQTPFARLIYELIEHDGPGRLRVSKDETTITIHISDRMICGLDSELLHGEALGDFLIRTGKVGREVLAKARQTNPEDDAKLATFLTHSGIIGEADMNEARIEYAEKIMLRLFSWEWRRAKYHFHHDRQSPNVQVQLALHSGTLIFEGVRRHYSNDRLGMIFAKKDRLSSLLYGTPKPPRALPTTAHRILDVIDNHRSATEVMESSGLAPLRFFQTLYAMWVMDLVRFGPNVQDAKTGIDNFLTAEQDAFVE